MKLKLITCAFVGLMAGAAKADTFIDTATQKEFMLSNMPDFDQLREWGTVTIGGSPYSVLGLNNNGSEYCVPTSAMDLCGFLALRGYPSLMVGGSIGTMQEDYRNGVGGWSEYNGVGFCIDEMAIAMGTSATSGTGGGAGLKGLQFYLDATYPGELVTCGHWRDSTGFPRATHALQAGLQGRLVQSIGGWYRTAEYNDATVYYRNGGHACGLEEAYWDTTLPGVQFYLCNPINGDSKLQQSAFSYDLHPTTPKTLTFTQVSATHVPIPGTQQTLTCDQISSGSTWILDGIVEICPLNGYTAQGSNLIWWMPFPLVNATAFPNGFAEMASEDGTPIVSASEDPLTGNIFYTSQGSLSTVFQADPIAQTTSAMQLGVTPRQVLCSAEFLPYVLYGAGNIGLFDPNTGSLTQIASFPNVDRLVYSPSNNRLVAINFAGRTATFMDHFGNINGSLLLPAVQNVAGTTVEMGPTGHLFLATTGSQSLHEIWSGGSVAHTIPDLAKSPTFALDDLNRVYLSVNGSTIVTSLTGAILQTRFSAMPGGGSIIGMAHTTSNFDPTIHGTPEWNDVPPSAG